jgi:hypothetical protein
MAEFHINAAGSNTAPYDTEVKGAPNDKVLKLSGLIAKGDTVYIDSSFTEAADTPDWPEPVNLISTKATKPVVTCISNSFFNFVSATQNTSLEILISGIRTDATDSNSGQFQAPPVGTLKKVTITDCFLHQLSDSFGTPVWYELEMYNCVIESGFDHSSSGLVPGYISISHMPGQPQNTKIYNNVFVATLNPATDVDGGSWISPFGAKAGSTVTVRDNIFHNTGASNTTGMAGVSIIMPAAVPTIIFEGNVKYGFGLWQSGAASIDVSDTNIVMSQKPVFVGAGDYSIIPATDSPDTYWRRMGTEYMSGIGMLPVGPWTFFIGANGSNTFPFDTAAKAARDGDGSPGGIFNLKELYARNGDIIELVAGGVIDASQAWQAHPWFHNVTIRSWAGNNGAVPVVQHSVGSGITFFHDLKLGANPLSSKMSGFKIISKAGTSIGGAVQLMVAEASQCPGVDGLEVSDMIFDFSTATSVDGVCYFDTIDKTKPLLGNGLKFNNNLVIASECDISKAFWLSNINANNAVLEIKNNTIVMSGNTNCLFTFGIAQPSTLQNINVSQNIIQVNDPEHQQNYMYLGASTNTIKGVGVKNNIIHGTKMSNMASPLECVIAPDTAWFLNTKYVDPVFADAANGDYSTPKGPQPSWGWQGWNGPTVSAEPFNLKHYPVAMRHIIGVQTSLAKAHGKTRAAETPFAGVLAGMCVGVTASGTFKKLNTYADGTVTKFVLATSSVQSLTDSSATLTTCESMGVPLTIPKTSVAGESMTYGEPVVAIIGGEDAGKVTTLDLAIPGSYTVVGVCLGDTDGGFMVETVQQYKVVK